MLCGVFPQISLVPYEAESGMTMPLHAGLPKWLQQSVIGPAGRPLSICRQRIGAVDIAVI
jgi:hypothetical protein